MLNNTFFHTLFCSWLKSFLMHGHWSFMINLDSREITMKKFLVRWGSWGSAHLSTSGERMAFHYFHLWFLCSFTLSGLSSCAWGTKPKGHGWETFKKVELTLLWPDFHPLKSACGQLWALPWSAAPTTGVSITSKSRVLLKPPGKEPVFDITFWSVCPSSKAPFWFLFSSILIHLLSLLSFWYLLSWPRYLRGLLI